MTAPRHDAAAAAAAGLLRRLHDAYRQQIEGLDDAAVNYRPGVDTNSIYQMAHHALDVERMWLSTAAGATIPGRPEPWTLAGPAADLAPRLAEAEQDVRRFLESPGLPDAALERNFRDQTLTVAVCWMRAVRHLAEHLGHIGLTRQMWEQYGSPEARQRSAER